MIQPLPASAQQPVALTIERLGQMNSLPVGQWKVHPGDLPHGESIDLDDFSWATAKPGDEYSRDAVWFRQTIVVPTRLNGYDLTGTRIWFSFQSRVTGQGSVSSIVYFDGRRVALGESLEQLVLFSRAKPGDRILVAVKLLGSPVAKRFQGSTERVEFATGRPSPLDLRDEIISALELLPVLSTNIPDDQATLVKAVQQVDVKALDAGDQQKFDASLRAAQTALVALKPPSI
jgi:alpha-mannosidase